MVWPNFFLMNVFFALKGTKSNRKAMNRNWSNQKANPALKTKSGNKYYQDGMELRDRKMTKDCTQPLRIKDPQRI